MDVVEVVSVEVLVEVVEVIETSCSCPTLPISIGMCCIFLPVDRPTDRPRGL